VFPFAFAALNFAHRSFVALEIFALAAAGSTRFTGYSAFCQFVKRLSVFKL
jgi:hypothetical protein